LAEFRNFVDKIFTDVSDFNVLTSHKTPEYDVPFVLLTFRGKGDLNPEF
jgi:hypothetical protein